MERRPEETTMIDHRWLPPREAMALGRRATRPGTDPRWRDAERLPRHRTHGEER